MKKIGIVLLLLFSVALFNAQGQRIALTSYKQIGMTNGKWNAWPANWTSYESEGRGNPEIEINELDAEAGIYNLKYYIDDELTADFHLVYDPVKTTEMRKTWNDKFVNCYTDGDDYVYVRGVSLQGLSQDSNAWATNSESKIYMWIPSDKMAVLVQ